MIQRKVERQLNPILLSSYGIEFWTKIATKILKPFMAAYCIDRYFIRTGAHVETNSTGQQNHPWFIRRK